MEQSLTRPGTSYEAAQSVAVSERLKFFNRHLPHDIETSAITESTFDYSLTGLREVFASEAVFIQATMTEHGAAGNYINYKGRTLLNWQMIFEGAAKSLDFKQKRSYFNPDFVLLAMNEVAAKAKKDAEAAFQATRKEYSGIFGLMFADPRDVNRVEMANQERERQLSNIDVVSRVTMTFLQNVTK